MSTPVVGNGPFEVTSVRGGLLSTPLSALSFNGNVLSVEGAWKTDVFDKYDAADQDNITKLLKYFADHKIAIPTAAASPKPAAAITAADAGSAGNRIVVTVAITTPNLDPTLVEFSISVTQDIPYTGLSAATLESVIGSDSVSGATPGLVQAVHASIDATKVPDAAVATYGLAGGAAGINARVDVNDAAHKLVFTLEARHDSADGDLTAVEVSNVQGLTFDMTVRWTKAVTGLVLGHLPADAVPLSYLITLAPPTSGAISVPAEGDTTLGGGSDGVSPVAAKATLFANQ